MISYFFRSVKMVTALLLMTLSFNMEGQMNSFSPYSRFGIGDLISQSSASALGMGGVATPIIDPFSVNLENPASYSMLFRSTLDIGLQYTKLKINDGLNQEEFDFSNPIYINMAFKKEGGNWGWLLGVRPFSSIGYSIIDEQIDKDAGKVEYRFDGEGGVLRGYAGAARKMIIHSKKLVHHPEQNFTDTLHLENDLSIGANLNYYFGTLSQISRVIFQETSYYDTRVSSYTQVSNLTLDLGVLYKHHLHAKKSGDKILHNADMVVGVDYELGTKMDIKTEGLSETIQTVLGREFPVDTSFYSKEIGAQLIIPEKFRGGIAFVFRKKNQKEFTVGFDYLRRDWTKYARIFNEVEEPSFLQLQQEFSAGLSYTPKDQSQHFDAPVLELATYRVGFKLSDTYLKLKENQLSSWSATGGISLPFKFSRSASRLNLGMEFGKRGTTNNGLIEETFYNAYIGFSFSPYVFDRWFERKKYD